MLIHFMKNAPSNEEEKTHTHTIIYMVRECRQHRKGDEDEQ